MTSRKILTNEKGMVLVVALLLVAVLILLGTTVVMTTTTDLKISGNYREGIKALYDAEAGVHYVIGRIKGSALSLPLSGTTTPTLTPPSGFSFSGVTLTNLGSNQYRLSVTGNGANNARKTVQVVFGTSTVLPTAADGAMAMYGSGSEVELKTGGGGGVNVDGNNYPLPANFNCTGSACRTTGSPSGAVTGLYTATAPTIEGNQVHLGGNPATRTGGGARTNQEWIDFVEYVISNNLYVENQMGTRDTPLITRVTSGNTLGGNMTGAGILIVDNGGAFDVGGTGHFEGLIILRGTGTFTGHGTGNIFGATITIDHTSKEVDLNGTVDILYSSEALQNLSKIGSLLTINTTSWLDTSLQ